MEPPKPQDKAVPFRSVTMQQWKKKPGPAFATVLYMPAEAPLGHFFSLLSQHLIACFAVPPRCWPWARLRGSAMTKRAPSHARTHANESARTLSLTRGVPRIISITMQLP